MNLLLHACCGPCTFYPVSVLRKTGVSFSAYFFNPNIHPFQEFRKRIEALSIVADDLGFNLIIDRNYTLIDFLRRIVFHEQKRCLLCYEYRLTNSIAYAKEHGFDAFSTTLLYSKYQNHDAIASICSSLCSLNGIEFFYHDFREGWQIGIDQSKQLNIYRQRYCGCIYSEQEAFDKRYRKKIKKRI